MGKSDVMETGSANCQLCTSMIAAEGFKRLASSAGFTYYNKRGCARSARDGCALCGVILKNASKSWKADEELIFWAIFREDIAYQGKYDLRPFDELVGRMSNDMAIIWLRLHTNEGDPMANNISRRPVKLDVAADEAFATAEKWIMDCQLEHAKCHYHADAPLPSRLIDVRSDTTNPTIQLHLSEKNERGAYAALSYCWGGTQRVVATANTVKTLEKGVDPSKLAKSIQDAIEATRRLGLKFLWVDALCILQDSSTDKDEEIQKMGQIYKNATVTISAAASGSASEGFLRLNRIPPPSCTFHLHLVGEGNSTIFVSCAFTSHPPDPLDRRGWTLQEFLLSPRLLVFSTYELIWYCQTKQCVTLAKSSIEYTPRMRLPARVFNDSLRGGKIWIGPRQRVKLWQSVVEEYSNRKLSEPEDRLKALDGVANELKDLWNDEYVYGIWRSSFTELLAWWTLRPAHSPHHGRSGRAPSWSWASLDCKITFDVVAKVEASVKFCNEDLKRVALRCKSISASVLLHAFAGSSSSRYLWDVASDDAMFHQAQCLFLGTVRSNKNKYSGIMAVPVVHKAGLRRRVGHFHIIINPSGRRILDKVDYQIVEIT